MKLAIVELESTSPYSQSKHYELERLEKEGNYDAEKRTWRERCHVGEDGHLFIPPMAFKNCIAEAARFLSIQIQGKGKSTWTKHFEAGILVLEGLPLPIRKEDVQGEWLFVPSDGRRGGGSRVSKCFPLIPKWSGKVTFHILDDTITEAAFRKHIVEAGQLIGIGRFRPRNMGFYGRFTVKKLEWKDMRTAAA